MAEEAPAAPPAKAPKPAKQRRSKPPQRSGTSVSELILKIVAASKDRSGVSSAAIKKGLAAGGYDVEKNKARIRLSIKALVAKEALTQVKGTGASGSYKIPKKAAEKKTKPVKKEPKKAAKAAKPAKAKKPGAKKPAAKKPAAKKPAAKKATKKQPAAKKVTKESVKKLGRASAVKAAKKGSKKGGKAKKSAPKKK